jgi:hypothetical protein
MLTDFGYQEIKYVTCTRRKRRKKKERKIFFLQHKTKIMGMVKSERGNQTTILHVGFEVLIAMVTKSSIFLHKTPCSPLKFNRRLGGTCRLHLHSLLPASRWFLALLILGSWRRKRHVFPKRRLTFNGLHGVTCQKIELFNCIMDVWVSSFTHRPVSLKYRSAS